MDSSEQSAIICENCNTSFNVVQKFCSTCGFPIGGNEDEKRSFRLIVSSRKRLLSDANKQVKNAKNIIYALAGIFLISGLFLGLANDDFGGMIVNLVLCLLYLILATWAGKNAFGAILTGFIVYITVQLLNAFVEPATLFQGIILKIVFIGAFIKGIQSALEAKKFLTELEKFKAVPVGEE